MEDVELLRIDQQHGPFLSISPACSVKVWLGSLAIFCRGCPLSVEKLCLWLIQDLMSIGLQRRSFADRPKRAMGVVLRQSSIGTPGLLNAVYLKCSCEYLDLWPCLKLRGPRRTTVSAMGTHWRERLLCCLERAQNSTSFRLHRFFRISTSHKGSKVFPASIWRMACRIRQ